MPQSENTYLYYILIGALSILLALCLLKILHLKKLLRLEKNKKLVPLITLDIQLDAPSLILKNEGDFTAKNIVMEDLNISLPYDFRKNLLLKFEKIDFLNPRQSTPLNFQSFDDGTALTTNKNKNLIIHLPGVSFQARIHYENMDNIPFLATIIKDQSGISVESICPLI